MNPLSILVYVVCGLVVLTAVIIFIRMIIRMTKGKCCDSCKKCQYKISCEDEKIKH